MILKALATLLLLFSTSTSKMEHSIIGGQYAKIEQFPHVVYLFVSCNGEPWSCGASILVQNVVLTAAHCLKPCRGQLDVVVYAGSEDVTRMLVATDVSLHMLHQSFDAKSSQNDIALARTQSALPLGATIKRVLLKMGFPRVLQAQIAGWGVVDEATNMVSEKLQWLTQSIGPTKVCSGFLVWPGMICIQHDINNRPSRGTSGCALLANYSQQIGLVSFRHPLIAELVVYTNVSYYYRWIQRNARKLVCIAHDKAVQQPMRL